ncbi:MAG: diphosphomevalonate decarboxylase [Myxococcales bacterium]|nr:diphosphomevalonate decarboxylase [Myxococcales bacterium]
MTTHRATATANTNIAIAKYWGKCDTKLNLPAVPSISLTLDGLSTTTTVTFDDRFPKDTFTLDGTVRSGRERERVIALLDGVRRKVGFLMRAEVTSENRIPTASGLASSASGFAALAAAATHAAGLRPSARELSRIARRASASAARSVFGGFVELPAGTRGDDRLAAKALSVGDPWPLRMVIAMTTHAEKAVGSTEGMERSRRTSPLYQAWVEQAPALTRRIRIALRRKDLETLGLAMEQSTMAFHGCALSARPSILYWNPATLAILEAVRDLRDRRGILAFATMDAGPHVKVLCEAKDAPRIKRALGRVPGVLETRIAAPGGGVQVEP